MSKLYAFWHVGCGQPTGHTKSQFTSVRSRFYFAFSSFMCFVVGRTFEPMRRFAYSVSNLRRFIHVTIPSISFRVHDIGIGLNTGGDQHTACENITATQLTQWQANSEFVVDPDHHLILHRKTKKLCSRICPVISIRFLSLNVFTRFLTVVWTVSVFCAHCVETGVLRPSSSWKTLGANEIHNSFHFNSQGFWVRRSHGYSGDRKAVPWFSPEKVRKSGHNLSKYCTDLLRKTFCFCDYT